MKFAARYAIVLVVLASLVGTAMGLVVGIGAFWHSFWKDADYRATFTFTTISLGALAVVLVVTTTTDWPERLRRQLAQRFFPPRPVSLGELTKQVKREHPDRAREFVR